MISAVVLAAGTSSRLGQPKQLLVLDGKPVLQHVVDAVTEGGFGEIVVVLGHESGRVGDALVLPTGARTVVNRDYALGQATSLRAGVSAVRPDSEAAAIFVGDQPHIDAACVRRVVEAFRAGHKPVARARYGGVPGHPVVVAHAAFGLFSGLSGDRGLGHLLDSSDDVVEVELGTDPPEDIDTWEQYERMRDG